MLVGPRIMKLDGELLAHIFGQQQMAILNSTIPNDLYGIRQSKIEKRRRMILQVEQMKTGVMEYGKVN